MSTSTKPRRAHLALVPEPEENVEAIRALATISNPYYWAAEALKLWINVAVATAAVMNTSRTTA